MVLRQDIDELLGEILRDLRIAVGDMGKEVDQFTKRDQTRLRGRRRRRHENFPVTLILVMLSAEVLNVRSAKQESVKVLSRTVYNRSHCSVDLLGIPANFMLQIGPRKQCVRDRRISSFRGENCSLAATVRPLTDQPRPFPRLPTSFSPSLLIMVVIIWVIEWLVGGKKAGDGCQGR